MTDGAAAEVIGTLISVRGEARETVLPDALHLGGSMVAVRPDKRSALAAAAELTDALTGALRELGGEPLSLASLRRPLTWSVHDAGADEEWDQSGGGRTGNMAARVSVSVTLRELDGLERLNEALAQIEALALHGTSWSVDDDNDAWPRVRAAAIAAAVAKARDYAAALGSLLVGVEHLADAGLLGDAQNGRSVHSRVGSWMEQSSGGGGAAPTLTPVPQPLVAVVDGRFRASTVRLDDL